MHQPRNAVGGSVLLVGLVVVALLALRTREGAGAVPRLDMALVAAAASMSGASPPATVLTHSRSASRTRSPTPSGRLQREAAPPSPGVESAVGDAAGEGEDYYAAYGEGGPVEVPVPVPGEADEGAPPPVAAGEQDGSDAVEVAVGGSSATEPGGAAATEPASPSPFPDELQPPRFHSHVCVPVQPTAGAGLDAWPVHPRDDKGGVPRFSRDVGGLQLRDVWNVSLCYTPVGRPVRVAAGSEPQLGGLRAVGMDGVLVVTRVGVRGAVKRHRGAGKDKLVVPSACDARVEYALPGPWADTYESLRFSGSPRVMRYGRLFAGPDELSVELEGPELLSLEPEFDSRTCSYSFHYGLTLPGRYRVRIMAYRGGYAGLNEAHRKYPETSFDSVLGDAFFFLAVDPGMDGGAAAAPVDEPDTGTSPARTPRPPPAVLELDAASLDATWQRVTGPGAQAALPACRSATAPAGRWVAAAAPSAVLLPRDAEPLRFPRLVPMRIEYQRTWWAQPERYAWLPYSCRLPRPLPLTTVRSCFARRRVLIAGDSHDRGLFALLVAHLWRISHVGVVPKTFTGTRCYTVPDGSAPWAVVGAVGLTPTPLVVDSPLARANASLARPLPPQLCFAWNHLADPTPLQLLDGRWDVVLFGFGHHPANGGNRWSLDRWRSAVSRVFRSVVAAAAVLDARARHEAADAAAAEAAANGTLGAAAPPHARLWRAPRVVWHSIPAPPVRKDNQPRQHGDGRTLQRLRAMNAFAQEAMDDAGGDNVPTLSTLDLWAMTLPLMDLAVDSVHYDHFQPLARAVVDALVGTVCGGDAPLEREQTSGDPESTSGEDRGR